jgi:pimeloyl-ACP methyl ester carboxylesterase
MSAIVIGGGLIHYEAFGHGEPILFIHGWLGSWRYWMRTMEELSADYRAYALDLWGFGDSDKSQERYSVDDYITLLSDFMEGMGIVQASLVGHALGATVALRFSIMHPDRVYRLATVSLPVTSAAISGRLRDFASNAPLAKMLWWRQITHKEVQQESDKMAENVLSLSIQSVAEVDTQTLIQQVSHLTLAVYGEKDNVVDPMPVRALNGQRANLRPIGLADSKHFPMLEETNKFNRLLKDFLELKVENNDLSALSSLELKEEWKRRTR